MKQYSCGWTEVPLDFAKKNFTQKFELKGGNPFKALEIKKDDVQKESGFLKSALNAVLNTSVKMKLGIKFSSKEKWTKD